MAALTAASWTVTILGERIENKQRIVQCSMLLPTTGEYTSGGVPIPTPAAMGMRRNLAYLTPYAGDPALARIFKYDPPNGTFRIYTASDGAELATTVTLGTAATLYVEAIGW